jgi:exosortase/archaeosortase family protein
MTEKRADRKKSIVLFCIAITVIMAVYFWIYNQPFFDAVNLPIVKGYAWIGHKVLNLFGQATSFDQTVILNKIFSIDISKGCDAVTPTILFLAAVLTFPIGFKLKWPALLIAPLALAALNTIRIVSLFLIGVYAPSFFEFAHIELWQALFIVFCFVGWVYWLVWANKQRMNHS